MTTAVERMEQSIEKKRMNKGEEEMKFFVIDEAGVDIYSDEFDTLEEANQAAQNEWEGLTDHDKIRGENHQRRIYVLRAKDEETLWDDNYSDETYFDSAK